MTLKNFNSSVNVRKTTLTRLKAKKIQGESYDHLLNRMLDTWEFEQKKYFEIDKATELAIKTIDSYKNELSDLFD
jgi:hypothetical protein